MDTPHIHQEHDHSHGEGTQPCATGWGGNERVVLAGFLLTASFRVAEIVGGLLCGSLALIADAGHMLTDAAALALAWAGFRLGRRASDSRRTFGYMRFEVLAGFINAITLFLLVAWIAYEAVNRLFAPQPVLAGPMFIVAVLGLLVNLGVFWMLHQGDTEHVNIRARCCTFWATCWDRSRRLSRLSSSGSLAGRRSTLFSRSCSRFSFYVRHGRCCC